MTTAVSFLGSPWPVSASGVQIHEDRESWPGMFLHFAKWPVNAGTTPTSGFVRNMFIFAAVHNPFVYSPFHPLIRTRTCGDELTVLSPPAGVGFISPTRNGEKLLFVQTSVNMLADTTHPGNLPSSHMNWLKKDENMMPVKHFARSSLSCLLQLGMVAKATDKKECDSEPSSCSWQKKYWGFLHANSFNAACNVLLIVINHKLQFFLHAELCRMHYGWRCWIIIFTVFEGCGADNKPEGDHLLQET